MKKKLRKPGHLNLSFFTGRNIHLVFGFTCSLLLFSCGGDTKNQDSQTEEPAVELADDPTMAAEDDGLGIGPVKKVDVTSFDAALAAKGKTIFESKCTACHQLSDQKMVGPGLRGVTQKRKPEWIMNMIINPAEMTQKDPEAKKLLAEHLTMMTNQDITEPEARALLEYLRQNDGVK